MQVAFIPGSPILSEMFSVILNRRRFSLYVHSYLSYGQQTVMQRVRQHLAGGRIPVAIEKEYRLIENPCLLKGKSPRYAPACFCSGILSYIFAMVYLTR